MKVILLQKVRNLGDLGDTADVKPGFGRNYLIPRGIALPATKANIETFEQRKSELKKASDDRRHQAELRADQLRGREFVIAMRASDEGKLFGSVGPQEIASKITEESASVDAREVLLTEGNLRLTGEYTANLELHADVETEVTIVVAQLTDMGINMPRRGTSSEEAETEEAAAESDDAGAVEGDASNDERETS
ncbi:50S ribosomal protein L9 [Salinisphaera orenii]|uniref:50S ribosomal protein L9 n=1 Tax=Salinisphaera orenii TaxID=856731 RepID=UPI000DBE72AB